MKKITKTTERHWQCPYCGFLNDLSENTCEKCGAVRNGDEVEKEITTNFEETTTTETSQDSDFVVTTRNSLRTILGVVIAILVVAILIPVTIHFTSSSSTKDDDYMTAVSKEWQYTVNIGEYVNETGITSYTEPPYDATNVTSRQVQQSNGWYKTEYTYDLAGWKVVRTEIIRGTDDVPNFKEYTPKDGEKIMATSTAHYTATFATSSGNLVINMSESEWMNVIIGQVYPKDAF